MARDPEQIRGQFDGRFYLGAKGATSPLTPFLDPDEDEFAELGYISDDGITFSRSREVAEARAMGVVVGPVWTKVTSQESQFSLNLMETGLNVLAAFFGQNSDDFVETPAVTGSGAHPQYVTLLEKASFDQAEYATIIDTPVLGTQYLYRRTYPRVQITETGDQTYNTNTPVLYPFTVKAMVGSDGVVCKHQWANLTVPATAFPPPGA